MPINTNEVPYSIDSVPLKGKKTWIVYYVANDWDCSLKGRTIKEFNTKKDAIAFFNTLRQEDVDMRHSAAYNYIGWEWKI